MPTRVRWIDKKGMPPREFGAVEVVDDQVAESVIGRGIAELEQTDKKAEAAAKKKAEEDAAKKKAEEDKKAEAAAAKDKAVTGPPNDKSMGGGGSRNRGGSKNK